MMYELSVYYDVFDFNPQSYCVYGLLGLIISEIEEIICLAISEIESPDCDKPTCADGSFSSGVCSVLQYSGTVSGR